jgi:uncharacterized membrane protein
MKSAPFLTRAAVIAAIYAVLTILLAPVSYGPVQVRISEALTPLAYIDPAAIIGLYVGALIANLFSPFGLIDILFGSLLTLIAAFATWGIGRLFKKFGSEKIYHYIGPLVGILPVVVFNAFGVALILKIAANLPYWPSVLYVGIGEAIAVYVIGYPLLLALMKTGVLEPK